MPSAAQNISDLPKLEKHFTRVPNSVIQYQHMATPAELRFALMAMMRPGCAISDETWEEWTGLDKRMKDMAIRGLKEKGLSISGHGKNAKYSFNHESWYTWTRSRPRHERARTMGRSKSVTAKTGMQVHQECRERGCSRLCESQVIPFPATQVEKPVSQNPPKEVASPPPKSWSKTLEAIQIYFPHVDTAFVVKLRAACDGKVHSYSDSQLACAIHAAKKRKANQQSEGLFLHTVPAQLAVLISHDQSQSLLTSEDKQSELKLAREILAGALDPVTEKPWEPKAHEWAKKILSDE